MKSKKRMVFVLFLSLLYTMASLTGCENIKETTAQSSKKIFSGSYSKDVTFLQSYKLYKNNGNRVNFWIENTGDKSVTITIDGKGDTEIKPGESGHISAKVGGLKKYHDFMAVQTDGNGGTMSFDYRIVQRGEQQ